MDPAQTLEKQISDLLSRVQSSKMPQDLKDKAIGMINVLTVSMKNGGNFSSFESASNYLSVISAIPFEDESQDILDLAHSKEILDKNHYGLNSVKERILEYLASIILNVKQDREINRAPILCLTGLVGTGKTTLAYSIAESLGRKFERIPLGGMGDVRELRGQSRVLPDAEPGQVIKKLIHSKSKNPVILLDELDRVTEGARADIMGALVELLDPEQNSSFIDHYVDYPVDLSKVLFIATANNTTNVSTAVLDRLEVLQMPSYSDEEKQVIGKQYLFPKIARNAGLPANSLRIEDSIWPMVIRPLGYDSGIRSLERTIEGMCRKVARLLVEGKIPENGIITINSQNARDFLPN